MSESKRTPKWVWPIIALIVVLFAATCASPYLAVWMGW